MRRVGGMQMEEMHTRKMERELRVPQLYSTRRHKTSNSRSDNYAMTASPCKLMVTRKTIFMSASAKEPGVS